MKKVALFATVLLFVSLAFSSCKSVQDCPAYDSQVTEIDAVEIRA